MIKRMIAALLCTLTLSLAACVHIHKEEVLQIYDRQNAYELNLPISKLVAFIPNTGSLHPKNNRVSGSSKVLFPQLTNLKSRNER